MTEIKVNVSQEILDRLKMCLAAEQDQYKREQFVFEVGHHFIEEEATRIIADWIAETESAIEWLKKNKYRPKAEEFVPDYTEEF